MTQAQSQSGFSLVEMMAALAVIAVAGLALMNMTQVTTRNTSAVQERALAALAAENVLNAQWLEPGPMQARSGRYELAGTDFDWRLDVFETDSDQLVRLHLVLRPAGSDRVVSELDTFRRRD